MIFMITGTDEIGEKFVGSEGFPDLKIGRTMKCFQSLGMTARVMEELMMCRMTPPIAGKPVLSIQDADTVSAASGGVAHFEDKLSELLERDGSRLKTACTDTRETHFQANGCVLGLDFGSNFGASGNKGCVEIISS